MIGSASTTTMYNAIGLTTYTFSNIFLTERARTEDNKKEHQTLNFLQVFAIITG